jgi:hypothetical protein
MLFAIQLSPVHEGIVVLIWKMCGAEEGIRTPADLRPRALKARALTTLPPRRIFALFLRCAVLKSLPTYTY